MTVRIILRLPAFGSGFEPAWKSSGGSSPRNISPGLMVGELRAGRASTNARKMRQMIAKNTKVGRGMLIVVDWLKFNQDFDGITSRGLSD